jgi:hypothetical protein
MPWARDWSHAACTLDVTRHQPTTWVAAIAACVVRTVSRHMRFVPIACIPRPLITGAMKRDTEMGILMKERSNGSIQVVVAARAGMTTPPKRSPVRRSLGAVQHSARQPHA